MAKGSVVDGGGAMVGVVWGIDVDNGDLETVVGCGWALTVLAALAALLALAVCGILPACGSTGAGDGAGAAGVGGGLLSFSPLVGFCCSRDRKWRAALRNAGWSLLDWYCS